MKQLLIVRVPGLVSPQEIELLAKRLEKSLNSCYDIAVTVESVERIEFEIVYNPHLQFAEKTVLETFNPVTNE